MDGKLLLISFGIMIKDCTFRAGKPHGQPEPRFAMNVNTIRSYHKKVIPYSCDGVVGLMLMSAAA